MSKRTNSLLAEPSPVFTPPQSFATGATVPVPVFSTTETGDVRVIVPRSRLSAATSDVLTRLRGVFAQALAEASGEGPIAVYLKRRQVLIETRTQLAAALANERELRQRHATGLDRAEPVDRVERELVICHAKQDALALREGYLAASINEACTTARAAWGTVAARLLKEERSRVDRGLADAEASLLTTPLDAVLPHVVDLMTAKHLLWQESGTLLPALPAVPIESPPALAPQARPVPVPAPALTLGEQQAAALAALPGATCPQCGATNCTAIGDGKGGISFRCERCADQAAASAQSSAWPAPRWVVPSPEQLRS
jgi:hypothetical protein